MGVLKLFFLASVCIQYIVHARYVIQTVLFIPSPAERDFFPFSNLDLFKKEVPSAWVFCSGLPPPV